MFTLLFYLINQQLIYIYMSHSHLSCFISFSLWLIYSTCPFITSLFYLFNHSCELHLLITIILSYFLTNNTNFSDWLNIFLLLLLLFLWTISIIFNVLSLDNSFFFSCIRFTIRCINQRIELSLVSDLSSHCTLATFLDKRCRGSRGLIIINIDVDHLRRRGNFRSGIRSALLRHCTIV